MGISLWLVEGVPMRVTWLNPMRMSLSKWMESMRNEWIEVNRTIWGDMSELKEVSWNNPMGISLWSEEGEPYESDLSEPNGKVPMSWEWVSLSIWLDWTLWECPYQNEWNRWEMNEMKWIEVNRGKMSEWMEMTWNNPMGMVLWSVESVPMEVTGMNPMRKSLSKWMESMRFEWNEVNRGE